MDGGCANRLIASSRSELSLRPRWLGNEKSEFFSLWVAFGFLMSEWVR